MDCKAGEGRGYRAQVLYGVIRKGLTVDQECQHLEEVGLPVELLLPLRVLAEDNKERLVVRYQGEIPRLHYGMILAASYSHHLTLLYPSQPRHIQRLVRSPNQKPHMLLLRVVKNQAFLQKVIKH